MPRICRNVDLPTPDAPTTATMSPGASVEVDVPQDRQRLAAVDVRLAELRRPRCARLPGARAGRGRRAPAVRRDWRSAARRGCVGHRGISKRRRNLLTGPAGVNARWDQCRAAMVACREALSRTERGTTTPAGGPPPGRARRCRRMSARRHAERPVDADVSRRVRASAMVARVRCSRRTIGRRVAEPERSSRYSKPAPTQEAVARRGRDWSSSTVERGALERRRGRTPRSRCRAGRLNLPAPEQLVAPSASPSRVEHAEARRAPPSTRDLAESAATERAAEQAPADRVRHVDELVVDRRLRADAEADVAAGRRGGGRGSEDTPRRRRARSSWRACRSTRRASAQARRDSRVARTWRAVHHVAVTPMPRTLSDAFPQQAARARRPSPGRAWRRC